MLVVIGTEPFIYPLKLPLFYIPYYHFSTLSAYPAANITHQALTQRSTTLGYLLGHLDCHRANMSSIITSLKDLIASVFEVIFSTFKSAFNGVYGIIHAFFGFFIDILTMVLNTVKGTLEAAGGVGKFVASEYHLPNYSESLN